MAPRVINVGIIGCGEVAQVIHIPTLNHMHEFYNITYLCCSSTDALQFCARRVANHIPQSTSDATVLCASPDVDVVFVVNVNEFHPRHTILALKHDKHVFVEKPMAMTEADVYAIMEAEENSQGKVFVGYMRRYAPAFIDAIDMIGGMENILYARVRDIIGPNSLYVSQSGTFPKRFSDYPPHVNEERATLAQEVAREGLGHDCHVEPTPALTKQYQVLGGLGSHDLSAMREALGMPEGVVGASFNLPFWNVLFKYPTFTVSYESGFYDVPFFDAHLEVYAARKSVRVQWDSPYVKGLPVTVHVREDFEGGLKETTFRKTYEDTFTLELKELHAMITEDKPIKTNARDFLQDLHIFQQILRTSAAAEKQ